MQSSFSTLFALYGGLFLFQEIDKGVEARVELDERSVKMLLWEEIDRAASVEALNRLQSGFIKIADDGMYAFEWSRGGYISKTQDTDLSWRTKQVLFRESSEQIENRLSALQRLGVNISE